jgi:hypothetical protein
MDIYFQACGMMRQGRMIGMAGLEPAPGFFAPARYSFGLPGHHLTG